MDSCIKTAFSYYNEQCIKWTVWWCINGVIPWTSISQYYSNWCGNILVKPLVETGVLKFFCRYVADTRVTIKKKTIKHALNSVSSFDKNLRFTVDTFDNGNIHFLDIKIWTFNNGDINIYIKDTITGLYVQYHSSEHSNTKTAWVSSLCDRAQKNFSNQHLLMTTVNYLKTTVMS